MQTKIDSFRDYRHIDKAFYIGSDNRFYEPNYRHYIPSDELRSEIEVIVEADRVAWTVHRLDVWTHVMPTDGKGGRYKSLPDQGWKIHISATNLNCKSILLRLSPLLVADRIAFKFANDTETLRLMTSKRWSRGGSGKFMTIYPTDEEEFRDLLERLYDATQEYEGSYILSDKRYRDSKCVYYRYGGIKLEQKLHFTGRQMEVLSSPNGDKVLDQRGAYFELPYWISDPYPNDDSEEQDALTLDDGRYHVSKALGFSNTGGVYLATDSQSGDEVIIKEARPHIELGPNGGDATTQLEKEAEILDFIRDLGVSPKPYRSFWDWENLYLVEEYFEAADIRGFMLSNSPLLKVHPTHDDSVTFYARYKAVILGLLKAVGKFHAAGVVIGDLSPPNVLVKDETFEVRIIDLEGAFRPAIDAARDFHTPGFRARVPGRPEDSSYADDLYAVGVIMAYSIFPIAALAYIRQDVFSKILPILVEDIGWHDTPVVDIVQKLLSNAITCNEAITLLDIDSVISAPSYAPDPDRPAVDLDAVIAGLATFISSNIRTSSDYTVFPIDPFGAVNNPLGFGFGATGVIHCLTTTGYTVPAEGLGRYRQELDAVTGTGLAPGLLVGSAGIALASFIGGDLATGRRFLAAANASDLAEDHYSLYYGMAGIGLANLRAYHDTGERVYLERAIHFGEALASSVSMDERGAHWRDGDLIRIGFGYGQAGVSLFLLRLAQITGNDTWRDLGRSALEYDISFGIEVEPGVISFGGAPEEKGTLEQYIEQGSAGIAKVAIRYGLWDHVDRIVADVYRKYSLFPGLIYGLSGLIDVLTDAYILSGDDKYLNMAQRPLGGLYDLYLMKVQDGYAVPGENMFRISCDYATGVGGVLHTLHRYKERKRDKLWLDELDGGLAA
jgi:serine/threonine protein kinase